MTAPKKKVTVEGAENPDVSGIAFATERHCPRCGMLHGSSLVPSSEVEQLQGVKLSLLVASPTYRVFYCGGSFHPVVHEEGAA